MPPPRFRSGPLADRSWWDKARCRSAGTDMSRWWFSGRSPELIKAIMICDTCSVQAACEAYADATDATYGVWAGRIRHRIRRPSKALKALLKERGQ